MPEVMERRPSGLFALPEAQQTVLIQDILKRQQMRRYMERELRQLAPPDRQRGLNVLSMSRIVRNLDKLLPRPLPVFAAGLDTFVNGAYSSVAVAPSPATSGTSVTVSAGDGTLFPTVGTYALAMWPTNAVFTKNNGEIAYCSGGRSSDTLLTLARAQESTSARTVVVGDQIGVVVTAAMLSAIAPWSTVAYAGGNFTTDTGTWTVIAGNQTTYASKTVGKTMTFAFDIINTTVASNPNFLRMTVPGGLTINRTVINMVLALDNGTARIAYAIAIAGNTFVEIARADGGTWSASTTNTLIAGEITFEIQ